MENMEQDLEENHNNKSKEYIDNEENVEKIYLDGKEIYIIATAHVSRQSVEQVKNIIENEKPDSVCVELCEERYSSINNEDQWKDMDIIEVIKKKKSLLLLVNLILSSFQKRIARQFGIKPGQEMIQGIKSAEEVDADLVLADRNIQITLKRVWRGLGFFEKIKLFFQIVFMIFYDEDISEEELEEMKSGDSLSILLSEMGDEFSGLKEHLIDERDKYLAYKIKNAKGNKVVAVLGAGHVPGVKRELKEKQDIISISKLPPRSKMGRIIPWLIPALIIVIMGYTFFVNRTAVARQATSWILWNGAFSALGAVAARGHILTVLTSFVAAPISSLNPAIAAGWFAGLTEAFLRKPQVKDFQKLSEDSISIKTFWTNKVTRVLLVVVLANLGSVLGTVIGGMDVVRIFMENVSF